MAPETRIEFQRSMSAWTPSMRPGQDGPGNLLSRFATTCRLHAFNEAGARWPRKRQRTMRRSQELLVPSMRPGQDGPGNPGPGRSRNSLILFLQ